MSWDEIVGLISGYYKIQQCEAEMIIGSMYRHGEIKRMPSSRSFPAYTLSEKPNNPPHISNVTTGVVMTLDQRIADFTRHLEEKRNFSRGDEIFPDSDVSTGKGMAVSEVVDQKSQPSPTDKFHY